MAAVIFSGQAAAVSPQQPSGKTPIPDQVAQDKALARVRELFQDEYKKARTVQEKTAVATKLLGLANQSENDSTSRFVLLKVTRDMAAQAGAIQTAWKAIDTMAATYDVDAAAMKLEALLEAAQSAKLTEHRKVIAERALPLIDTAIRADDYATAARLAEAALAAARKIRDGVLVKRIAARNQEITEIEKAYAEIQQALTTLEEKPIDPQANLAVGEFCCLIKGDWEKGIPMLALGSDPAMKALAQKELKGPTSPEEEIALGDGWRDLAERITGSEKNAILLHAGSWYKQALTKSPSGLTRITLEKRLQNIENICGAAPDLPTWQIRLPKGAVLLMTFESNTFKQADAKMYVEDLSGNNNRGVVHGAAPVKGIAGNALSFDGKDDYVECKDAKSLNPTQSLTVCAWINVRSWKKTHSAGCIVSKDAWPARRSSGYVLRFHGQQRLDFTIANPKWNQATSPEPTGLQQWHHVAATYNSESIKLFVDGTWKASAAVKEAIRPSSCNLRIGRGTFEKVRGFDGVIDEVILFNRALSKEEIQGLYQRGLQGKTLIQ